MPTPAFVTGRSIEEIGSDADVLLKIIQDESYEPSEADMTNLDRVGDECGLS